MLDRCPSEPSTSRIVATELFSRFGNEGYRGLIHSARLPVLNQTKTRICGQRFYLDVLGKVTAQIEFESWLGSSLVHFLISTSLTISGLSSPPPRFFRPLLSLYFSIRQVCKNAHLKNTTVHTFTQNLCSQTFSLTRTHASPHMLSRLQHPACSPFLFASPTTKGVHAVAAKTNKCVPSHRRAPQKAVNTTR